jgi:transketolase
MNTDLHQLQQTAIQVRRDIVRMVHGKQSGHPGGSLGCTEFMFALYFHQMEHNVGFNMDGIGEDIFFLSNGHISPVFYSVLARSGYFPVSELATFRAINSRLQGHPTTHEGLPGVRVASGSLGQGLSVACGAAMAKKLNNDSHIVYTLHGDGELQEGQNWEAIMFAAHHKCDNLIATIDVNGQQIDGPTNMVMNLGNIGDKFTAFGWHVLEMAGNDMHTVMGKGVSFMEGTHEWHGIAPSDAQLQTALDQLLPETLGDY